MTNNIRIEMKNTYKVAKKEYLIKFLVSILLRGALLIIPVLYSMAINYITSGEYSTAILLFVVSIIVTALYRFFEGANQYFYYKLYNKLSSHYTNLAISKTNDNSMYSLSRFDLGTYTNTVISDVDVICVFMSSLPYRLVQLLEFIIIFYYFYSLNIIIFALALTITIIMVTASLITGNKIEQLNKELRDNLDKSTTSFHEYFMGIRDIKSFNLFNNIAPQVNKKVDNYLESNMAYNVKYQYYNHAFLYIFEFFRLATMIYGVSLIKNNILDIGVLLIIYNYYQKIIDNFTTVLTMRLETRNLHVSLDRYYKIVEYSQIKDNKEYLPVSNIEGNVEFKNVIYGDKNDLSLNGVSFIIPSNSITIITGKTNNGKSGIFELLLKLNRQHEGSITIDDYDINDIKDDDYFEMVSSARKQTVLFKSSIKNNLSVIKDDEEKIINVCKSIGAHELINDLSNGYDTIIGDNNINDDLRQLLSIARVLMRNSRIMLFDEAINGLDDVYKSKVIKLFEELKTNHTIIAISHDKNLFSVADKIIVMDDHKVAEEGSISKLSNNKGVFYYLYEKDIKKNK